MNIPSVISLTVCNSKNLYVYTWIHMLCILTLTCNCAPMWLQLEHMYMNWLFSLLLPMQCILALVFLYDFNWNMLLLFCYCPYNGYLPLFCVPLWLQLEHYFNWNNDFATIDHMDICLCSLLQLDIYLCTWFCYCGPYNYLFLLDFN